MLKECFILFCAFFKVGAFTFGGGIAMLPMLKKYLVEDLHYITEEEMLDYFAISQCTPGVIAVNVATFVGYKRAGVLGAATATLGVIFPSFIVIIILAHFISLSSGVVWFQKAVKGVNIAVATLLARAFFSISKKTIIDVKTFFIFLIAFVAIAFFSVSGFYVIIASGILGYVISTIKEKRKK
ncbi:MAG: chromate transporter [Treponema sp.]